MLFKVKFVDLNSTIIFKKLTVAALICQKKHQNAMELENEQVLDLVGESWQFHVCDIVLAMLNLVLLDNLLVLQSQQLDIFLDVESFRRLLENQRLCKHFSIERLLLEHAQEFVESLL